MISIVYVTALAAAILIALYALARVARRAQTAPELSGELPTAHLIPEHFKYFPQVRQALSKEDSEYLARRATSANAQRARRNRRDVGLEFLSGLHEDYRRINRFARVLVALAPNASFQRETERLRMAIHFEVVWAFVWLRLWAGGTPIGQLGSLADMIGTLATQLEGAMAALPELSGAANVGST
jgi:ABC-type anion transport system duplicated permease subunit